MQPAELPISLSRKIQFKQFLPQTPIPAILLLQQEGNDWKPDLWHCQHLNTHSTSMHSTESLNASKLKTNDTINVPLLEIFCSFCENERRGEVSFSCTFLVERGVQGTSKSIAFHKGVLSCVDVTPFHFFCCCFFVSLLNSNKMFSSHSISPSYMLATNSLGGLPPSPFHCRHKARCPLGVRTPQRAQSDSRETEWPHMDSWAPASTVRLAQFL